MDLEQIKRYIRVDSDDEDVDIQLMWDAAISYVSGSVGEILDTDHMKQIKVLKTIKTLYDNRELIGENGAKSYITEAMELLMQIDQME